jgi:UDP-2,3-diacylglucosamine diphosphatase
MHGNRDFLLGGDFFSASGAQPLADPSVRVVGGVETLLMHGDTLCTDDLDYMAWRGTVRSPAWQAEFMATPIEERRARSRALRIESEARKRTKSAAIMDVNLEAVRETFRLHAVARLVHGHTHRALGAAGLVRDRRLPAGREGNGPPRAFSGPSPLEAPRQVLPQVRLAFQANCHAHQAIRDTGSSARLR